MMVHRLLSVLVLTSGSFQSLAFQSARLSLGFMSQKGLKRRMNYDSTCHKSIRMMSSTPVVEETAALGDVTTYTYLESAVSAGLVKAFGDDFKDAKPMLTLSTRPEFGDYQCNAAMPLAKALKSKPRDIAQRLVEALEVGAACEQPEIAGPGFINLRLRPEFVTSRLQAMVRDPERLGVPRSVKPQRVVVDFSSPNIAKEMHVGHLRSTIIGDTLCRVLDFLGHDVVRLNHVGDWGTQFGMLIAYLKEVKPEALTNPKSAAIGDLVQFYKQAKARFDEDDKFKTVSRAEVVKLQSGDEENYKAWQLLCEISRQEFDQIYSLLNIKINERGESFYNEFLPDVVNDLEEKGLAVKSEGATCVFLEGFKNRDGQAMPLIIRKTDGGFMYSTTDLAAIRHRVEEEKADRILYVTDVGQSSHFSQVFQVARRAGILPDSTELQHVPFGLVQGEDGKKFKTRSGDTVKLKDLLMEAVNIATADMEKRYADEGQEMGEAERLAAQVVGLGAVKYADLSMNRESDYRFSYKKMLSLTGNTAPYMLYAYVRVKGIQRKGAEAVGDFTGGDIVLQEESEINLARKLLRLPEVLAELESDLYPHKLCEYLFDVSQKFNKFYESCPVNTAETEELKRSRVALCEVTANVIKKGLSLLGIDTVDKL